ncbi:MAG: dTDP-4-dehydrorhamnose 3,5-epimerase [Synechococcales cyanobacterium RM1_1_8]|nr:dTDP-4-dehydrorhamnose 3,5-epimerase [Synechococcales cyanobacterium RM1_1_8]
MALAKQIELVQLASVQGGMSQFYTPQASDQTMLVQIPAHSVDDLFVHRNQTDQLLVVRGSFVLVVLENRRYCYIPLSEKHPQLVRIPPGICHGSINFSHQPCTLVNAVLRHGPAIARDYQPAKPPLAYDFQAARQALAELEFDLPQTA